MISLLIDIGNHWRNPSYHLRQEAIQCAAPEFCLSKASFELALDWIFSCWNEKTIATFASMHSYQTKKTIQILAGNTPAVMAQAFLHGALLGSSQIFKIPSLQPTFPRLLQESFKEMSQALADVFFLESWQDNLAEFYAILPTADLVIAYGSDETVSLLKSYCLPETTFLAEGHAVSCAVIFKEAANRESLSRLAWDMLSYDQRGCLSPRVTFVEQGGELTPAQCARVFAREMLPALAEQLPRGGLFPGEAVAIRQRSAVYGFHGNVYSGTDWTVCYDDTLAWPEESLPRFMPFKSFARDADLLQVLQPIENHLVSIGVAGGQMDIFSEFSKLKHICQLGDMQRQLLSL